MAKHNLILGEAYQVDGREFELVAVAPSLATAGGVGIDNDFLILATVEDDGIDDIPVSFDYWIDDAGGLWELRNGDGGDWRTPSFFRSMGMYILPTTKKVADLVPEGVDPEVWGRL